MKFDRLLSFSTYGKLYKGIQPKLHNQAKVKKAMAEEQEPHKEVGQKSVDDEKSVRSDHAEQSHPRKRHSSGSSSISSRLENLLRGKSKIESLKLDKATKNESAIEQVKTEVASNELEAILARQRAKTEGTKVENGSWGFWGHKKTKSGKTKELHVQKPREINSSPKKSPEVGTSTDKTRTSSWSFWSQKPEVRAPLFEPNVIVQSRMTEFSRLASQTSGEIPQNDAKDTADTHVDRPNLIVPAFEDTIPSATAFTSVQVGYKRVKKMLGYEDDRQCHLYRKPTASSFKRVLIIGIHGFFPTRVLRPIIGSPTGTSTKFAQTAEKAVFEWAADNDMNVKVQKIALEKEGKIFERVNFFFDIMKKFKADIQKADFIFVCAHSQGTPVAIILLSKLLEYGIIGPDKRIGVLGMAGINNGPFHGMEQSLFVRAYSTFENESMMELFQFQNFESLQSRKYLESIRNLVRHNAKITYVGSIDDQLVPLYSSIASHVKHPNIYKAVYIDGGSDTPDFVSRIVKLSCMLQDLGYSDHDVVKEISYALAGPLTGGGHSTVYNDLDVYKLALDFTLKTEDSPLAVEEPVLFRPFDLKKLGANPFNLPWCVRGLFFEAIKRLQGGSKEIEMVFKEFDEWDPTSKPLKDVKYRLNGIKAKI